MKRRGGRDHELHPIRDDLLDRARAADGAGSSRIVLVWVRTVVVHCARTVDRTTIKNDSRVAEELPESARRVQHALTAAGIKVRVVTLPQSTRTATDAAAAIGCRVEQIAKSLVFRRADSGDPVLIIASGTNRIDEQLVCSHLNAKISKADADFVRSTTGFAIGGVPPLGHDVPLQTLIDQDLLRLDTIWAAAGTPHAVFSITPSELVRATRGRVVPIARDT